MGKDRARKKLVVNLEEAEVVRLIYEWYLSGLGAKGIAQRLNQEGYLYRGKPWQKNRILDIIGDEAYIGTYYFNRKDKKNKRLKPKEEWIPVPVEPIIDHFTWEKAKALKAQRDPSKPGQNPAITGSKTLLTGLAVCGLCGANVTLETAKSGQYTYSNCSNYFRRGKTAYRGQRIPAHNLEQAILDHLANKLFTKQRVKAILKGVYKEIRDIDKRGDGQRKSLNRQLDVIKTKLTRQYEAIESGAIDLQLVAERIRELKARRTQVESRLEELKFPRPIPLHFFKEESIGAFQSTIKDLFLGQENRVMTKRYLKLFIEKIKIKLPKVEIVAKSDVVLAVLENKEAVSTDGVLTAVGNWLPGTDSNRRLSG